MNRANLQERPLKTDLGRLTTWLVREKKRLFAMMGFAGGVVGDLLTEMFGLGEQSGAFLAILHVAFWFGCCGAAIAFGLRWAGELYHRKLGFPGHLLLSSVISGGLAGALAGGIAQAIYSMQWGSVLFQIACWGFAGALLGWRLAPSIPNLGAKKGFLGGGLGGLFGGTGFIFLAGIIAELPGRVMGIGIIGAALGLCIVAIEVFFREASLEVIWAPNEITHLSLGMEPIYIGSGKRDHVHVRGLAEHAIGVVLNQGKIICTQKEQQPIELKHGSKITVGRIQIRVRAKGQGTKA